MAELRRAQSDPKLSLVSKTKPPSKNATAVSRMAAIVAAREVVPRTFLARRDELLDAELDVLR
jgi:hypothetical protein